MAGGYDLDNAYALIIGISNYKDPNIRKLNYTKADAEGILDILKDPRKVGLKQDNIKVMLDEEATLFNIKKAISGWLYKYADKESTVFVYFAGHGGIEEDRLGIEKDNWAKFLLAYDSEIDNLYSTSISNREFNDLLLTIRSKRLVIFMDSCYSGGVSESKARDVSVKITDDPYVKLAEGEGRLVIAASQPDQRSFEDAKLGHGVFTYHLMEALSGKADTNNDGYVTVTEIYNYLADKVPKSAMQLASAVQEPILRGNIKKDFVLSIDREKIEKIDQVNEKNKQIEELRISCEKLHNEGKYIEAIIKWKEILKIDPGNGIAKDGIRKAEDFIKNRDLDRLLGWFSQGNLNDEQYELACCLIESSPDGLSEDDAKVKKLLDGLLLGKIPITRFRKDIDRIKNWGESAIPSTPEPELGDIGIKIQKENETKGKKIDELNSTARVHLNKGKYDEAIDTWNEVLNLDPENHTATDGIDEANSKKEEEEKNKQIRKLSKEAQRLSIEGNHALAIPKWREILDIEPGNRKAIEGLRESEKILKNISELNVYALRLYDEGMYNRALEKWNEVLKIDPYNKIAIEGIENLKNTQTVKKYCTRCGQPNIRGVKFCTKCGTNLIN